MRAEAETCDLQPVGYLEHLLPVCNPIGQGGGIANGIGTGGERFDKVVQMVDDGLIRDNANL
jgi:hypothetical protein